MYTRTKKITLFIIIYYSINNYVISQNNKMTMTYGLKLKRQTEAGYMYNRPNIPFDLPRRLPSSTTQLPSSTTQLPSPVITQVQQMYYAYPVPGDTSILRPAPGEVVNIGFPNLGSSMTTTNPTSASGYNYGLPVSSIITNSPNTAENPPIASSGRPSPSVTTPIPVYNNYNSPTPTTVGLQRPQGPPSTNAPTYLPPIGISNLGISVTPESVSLNNAPSVNGNLNSVGVPDSYLPPTSITIAQVKPVKPENTAISQYNVPISTENSPSSTPQGYLPPSASPVPQNSDTISTPAPTYLPPLL